MCTEKKKRAETLSFLPLFRNTNRIVNKTATTPKNIRCFLVSVSPARLLLICTLVFSNQLLLNVAGNKFIACKLCDEAGTSTCQT